MSVKLRTRWNRFVKNNLRKVGIFPRLAISFLLLLLVSALFLTLFSFRQYSREINRNLDRYASLLVQNVEWKIHDTMQNYEEKAVDFYGDGAVIGALKANDGIREEDDEAANGWYQENTYLIENKLYRMGMNERYLVNIQFVTPFRQYHMAEPNGYQRGGTIRDLESFYESEFYLLPQETKGYPIWMDSSKQSSTFYKNKQSVYGIGNTVTLGIAVYEPSKKTFLGVLIFNIDLNAFSGVMEGYTSYQEGNIFLVGQNGVLMWYNPRLSAPSFPKDQAIFSEMAREKQKVLRTKADGREVLLAYEKVGNTGFFVSYIADLQQIMERPHKVRNLCMAVLAGTVLVGLILSWYVTISISDPVKKLVWVMKTAGEGKWEVRCEEDGHDEITVLAERFNEMADKTNQLIEQVYVSEINRQKMQLSLKNAQLDVLLGQINPHFLYNTLDIIRWEAMYEANGESAVTEMIETFSRLCRMNIRMDSRTIRLKEILEQAEVYMEVINFRHREKISLKIEAEVDIESCYLPQFTLQPLIENAVVHAFEDAGRKGCLRILAKRQGEDLFLMVEDNGKGMEKKELEALEQALNQDEIRGNSIGLVNVSQRIRLLYGKPYGIRIFSTPGEGSQIEVVLPLRTYSENMESIIIEREKEN
jgi:sensor histidine kinase YesM